MKEEESLKRVNRAASSIRSALNGINETEKLATITTVVSQWAAGEVGEAVTMRIIGGLGEERRSSFLICTLDEKLTEAIIETMAKFGFERIQ